MSSSFQHEDGGSDLLFYKLKELITEQSEGEWTEAQIFADALRFANALRPMLAASPQQSPEPLDALIDDAFDKMKPFCKACQAIPTHGYCNMAGCPMPRPQQPADERLPPETGANHQDRGVTDWTDLRLAAEAAEWLERQPAGTFNANDIKHRFRKLATPRAVLALVEAADRAVSQ